MLKRVSIRIAAGLIIVGLSSCGENDKMRQRVQDLENEKNAMQTEMEQLRQDNEDLKKERAELAAEKEAMMTPSTDSVVMTPRTGDKTPGQR